MSDEDPNFADSDLSASSDSDESEPSFHAVSSPHMNQSPRVFRVPSMSDETGSDTESSVCSVDYSPNTVADPDEETRSLPCEHKYLGDLCQIDGRTIMDDGSIQRIPLLFPASQITLVPGQSFPLMETEENSINILKYSIQSDHIFGIISSTYWNQINGLTDVIGTTAEVIAYCQTDESFKIKAIGRQRFKILTVTTERINNTVITFAKIRILPEVGMEPFLEGVRLSSLNKIRPSQRYKCFRRETGLTQWPSWLCRNYDEKYLVQEIKNKLAKTFLLQKNFVYANDASTLSFQLLKNIPISEKLILEAMALNSPIQRLRWFLNIINSQTGKLRCATCHATIGYAPDIFAMSAEGAHGTYVNSLGYVHELITLRKVQNVAISGEMDTNYSWFPGYAWTVLTCKGCRYHLGWKFTAQQESLVPNEFWGIRNSSIDVKYQKNGEKQSRRRSSQPYHAFLTRFS